MRFSRIDLVFFAAFLIVGGGVAVRALPPSPASVLARQNARVDAISRERKAIALLPPPATREEAGTALAQLDRLLALDRGARWEEFGDFLTRRAPPGVAAEFERRRGEFEAAGAALRKYLADVSTATGNDSPGIDARRTERGVALVNAFEDAQEGLETWAARLAPSDF